MSSWWPNRALGFLQLTSEAALGFGDWFGLTPCSGATGSPAWHGDPSFPWTWCGVASRQQVAGGVTVEEQVGEIFSNSPCLKMQHEANPSVATPLLGGCPSTAWVGSGEFFSL